MSTLFIRVLLLCGLFSGMVVADAAPLRIMTTTTDLAALAGAVGGDLVDVRAIARGHQDPHYVDARPSFMRRLHSVDLLIYNGLELEIGWLPLLVQGSRNGRLRPGAAGILNASVDVPVMEIPTGELDRSLGDIHPEGNPHYTLSPLNGRIIAGTIATRLKQLRPGETAAIDSQHHRFVTRLDDQINAWTSMTQNLRGIKVIAHHKQFEYLAAWLGLEIVGYIEEKPGIPPTPRHVSDLATLLEREQVRMILRAEFVDGRPAARLADGTGARVVVLPAAVADDDDDLDYAALFEVIIDRLQADHSTGEGG